MRYSSTIKHDNNAFRESSLLFSMILAASAIVSLASILFFIPRSQAATQQSRFYAATSYAISGSFLTFFDKHGGLRIFGYPISDRITEGGRPVQYFERQRFEYHSEAAGTANEVQLGRLGADQAPPQATARNSPPFQSKPNRIYVPQTRHSLSNAFLDFWRANGDVRVLGYPISEPVIENGYTVQYFERARMEYHPEKAAQGYGIQLGLLGRQYLGAHPEIAGKIMLAARKEPPTSRGAGAAPPAPPATNASAALSGKESELFQRINEARNAAGAGRVSLDDTLRGIALSRSKDMVARNYFSHTTPEGTDFLGMLRSAGVAYKFAGEIIANNNYGDGETALQAYNSFMNSPHHQEIMLDPRYSVAGVGEQSNSVGFHYFTVIFVEK